MTSFNKTLLPIIQEDDNFMKAVPHLFGLEDDNFMKAVPHLFGLDFTKHSKEHIDQVKALRTTITSTFF